MYKSNIVGFSKFTAKSGVEYYSYICTARPNKNWIGDDYVSGLISCDEYGTMAVGDNVLIHVGYGEHGRKVYAIMQDE